MGAEKTLKRFPSILALFKAYWPILLLISVPSIASLLIRQVVTQEHLLFSTLCLLPLSIIAWVMSIGLNLHIVDNYIQPISLLDLFTLGGSFWTTIFRAGLLLGLSAMLIFLPAMFLLKSGDIMNPFCIPHPIVHVVK